MKNIKDLGEKVAIQCKTPEAFIEIKRQLNAINLEDNYWGDYKENTCIRVSDNTFCRLQYFIDKDYTILQASDFMPLSPQDEIKELKARIATLEESLRPKKKIEFVKFLNMSTKPTLEIVNRKPSDFKYCEKILSKFDDNQLDMIECWNVNRNNSNIYLGHFNDGMK